MRNVIKIVAAVATVAAVSATATMLAPSDSHPYAITETASINTSASSVGFSDSDIYGMSADDVNRTLDLMKATGVNTVRLMMPWAGMEPDQGRYDFGQVDLMVDAANARGMSVLGTLVSTPAAGPVAPGLARGVQPRLPAPRRTATSRVRSPPGTAVASPRTRSGTSRTPRSHGRRGRRDPSLPCTPAC